VALWFVFDWTWTELSEETITAAAVVIGTIAAGLLIFLFELTIAPVQIHEEQQEAIRAPVVSLRQPRGHRDCISASYPTADSWIVIIRDLIITDQHDQHDVISLQLWMLFNDSHVVFSPRPVLPLSPPPQVELGSGPFLRAVENIAARSAVMGTAIFEIPKSTVPPVRYQGSHHSRWPFF
jgi:hypothetical protein